MLLLYFKAFSGEFGEIVFLRKSVLKGNRNATNTGSISTFNCPITILGQTLGGR